MRLLFMGTPDFAVPSLRRLHERGHAIVSVVTRPDSSRGRGRALAPPPVKTAACELGLPVLQPEEISDVRFIDALKALDVDLFVVVAFRILPKESLAIPRQGSVNLHPSLLPKYRGAAPIPRAIMAGETATGLTTFLIQPRVDAGDILMQKRVAIAPDETAGELTDRLKFIGADLLLDTVEGLAAGILTPRPQSSRGVSRAPSIKREDARVDWSRDAQSVRNQIRGTHPKPGAFTTWRGEVLKIHRGSLDPQAPPGQCGEIVAADPTLGVSVQTSNHGLRLEEVQPSGKKHMSGAEWVRGYRVQPGESLGE